MRKKFIIEFEYKEIEEDVSGSFKYSIEGAMEELMYDCLEVGQISDFDIIKVEEIKSN